MKKYIYYIVLTIFGMLNLAFTSCGSDSDDDGIEGSLSSMLTQYAWKTNAYYDTMEWDEYYSFTEDYVTLFFLSGGEGIGKYDTKEIDTYFGTSNSSEPKAFTYSLVNGSSVMIDGKVYRYKNDQLVAPDGTTFYKTSITSSDRKWLESAKYYLMDDYDRLNIIISSGCEPIGNGEDMGGGNYLYAINLYVGVKGTEHAYSRQISSIEATYTIKGGTFDSKKPKTTLIILADEDCHEATFATVSTKSTATITASFRLWDSKTNRYVDGGTAEYTVGEEHNGGNNGGNGGSAETKTYTVNGVSFKMIGVEGGTFQMGSTTGYGDEEPVHSVTLSSYSIGETEVTQALWKAVMGTNPSNWQGDNLPVEKVSWNDCQAFITKLNQLTGKTFRLPTEAEWEFAAKGGTKSKGYTYSGSNTIGDVAWYRDNSSSKTHPVATKQANELGIYDMSGNVFEWCQDWYLYTFYSSGAQSNPTGPTSGSSRVDRGGSWYGVARGCRSAYRSCYSPDYRSDILGLRLVL